MAALADEARAAVSTPTASTPTASTIANYERVGDSLAALELALVHNAREDLALLALVMALGEGFVPATIGYQKPDPECDLDVVPNVGRRADIQVALSNSLGFGGHNAAVVLKKWTEG